MKIVEISFTIKIILAPSPYLSLSLIPKRRFRSILAKACCYCDLLIKFNIIEKLLKKIWKRKSRNQLSFLFFYFFIYVISLSIYRELGICICTPATVSHSMKSLPQSLLTLEIFSFPFDPLT